MMTTLELKITLYASLSGAAMLAVIILFMPEDLGMRAQSVLLLFVLGVLVGMTWQLMINHPPHAAGERQEEEK